MKGMRCFNRWRFSGSDKLLLLEPDIEPLLLMFGLGTLTKAETAEPRIFVATHVTNELNSPG
ncbi:Uncharacterised protein [Acinetobacter baumannii]|nr:Uncharacterised protein [Acinetobacter baumannii]